MVFLSSHFFSFLFFSRVGLLVLLWAGRIEIEDWGGGSRGVGMIGKYGCWIARRVRDCEVLLLPEGSSFHLFFFCLPPTRGCPRAWAIGVDYSYVGVRRNRGGGAEERCINNNCVYGSLLMNRPLPRSKNFFKLWCFS